MIENKLSKSAIAGWISGAILVFVGFIGIMASDFILGITLIVMGMILIPLTGKFIESKWDFKLTPVKKTIFLIAGFFFFVFNMESPDPVKTAPQVIDQKSASEIKTENEVKMETPVALEATQIAAPASEQSKPQKALYSVLRVVDGDTVAIEIDGKQEVLRLIGINTPETVDPRTPVECFGKEASNKAKEILTGKKVSIEADSTQDNLDKYKRPLRYVYLEDGTNFNKRMIEEGYAYEYTYNTPYKYQADFKEAERKAKEEKRGLWAEDTCNGNLTKSTTNTAMPATVTSQVETKTTSQTPTSSGGTCAGKKTCGQMANCQEANFYLNTCGVGSLDRDKDGIPCETICN